MRNCGVPCMEARGVGTLVWSPLLVLLLVLLGKRVWWGSKVFGEAKLIVLLLLLVVVVISGSLMSSTVLSDTSSPPSSSLSEDDSIDRVAYLLCGVYMCECYFGWYVSAVCDMCMSMRVACILLFCTPFCWLVLVCFLCVCVSSV